MRGWRRQAKYAGLILIFSASVIFLWLTREPLVTLLSTQAVGNVILFAVLAVDALLFAYLYVKGIAREQEFQLTESYRQLEEGETRLTHIVNGLPIPAFVIDDEHRITHWNDACEAMTGKKREEMVGTNKQWVAFYDDERPVLADLIVDGEWDVTKFYPGKVRRSALVKDGFVAEDFFSDLGKHGKWLSFSAAPIFGLSGQVVGAIETLIDITKEKEMDRMKNEFLSIAAHQLRTPLGAMRWSVDMLASGDLGKLPPDANEMIGTVSENMHRLIALVDDLLNVSRIDQGRVKDEPVEVDLVAVARAIVAELGPDAERRRVRILVRSDAKRVPVTVDPVQIREVMENLVSNAVKYNRPNGEAVIRIERQKAKALVEVRDTGFGIPPKDQSRIFSKFFRASNAIHSEADGSGLGLFVVKSYVERWGGTVRFESKEGKGTAFTFTVPNRPRAYAEKEI